jgi:hypothetical protein
VCRESDGCCFLRYSRSFLVDFTPPGQQKMQQLITKL